MIGMPEKTICMGLDEAMSYVQSRLIVLKQMEHDLQEKLEDVRSEIDIELDKLHMLNNPPSDRMIE